MVSRNSVNIGSSNGFLPGGIKPLPQPILLITYSLFEVFLPMRFGRSDDVIQNDRRDLAKLWESNYSRADSRLAPTGNERRYWFVTTSHRLGANLESALYSNERPRFCASRKYYSCNTERNKHVISRFDVIITCLLRFVFAELADMDGFMLHYSNPCSHAKPGGFNWWEKTWHHVFCYQALIYLYEMYSCEVTTNTRALWISGSIYHNVSHLSWTVVL